MAVLRDRKAACLSCQSFSSVADISFIQGDSVNLPDVLMEYAKSIKALSELLSKELGNASGFRKTTLVLMKNSALFTYNFT